MPGHSAEENQENSEDNQEENLHGSDNILGEQHSLRDEGEDDFGSAEGDGAPVYQ